MALGAAVLGAGFLNTAGSFLSNAINSATQYKINADNASMQYAINADQIEAARMNNETAIEMANTAHQREVRDLRDANLNPILSASGSGSAVPSLDTPGLEAPQAVAPTIDNPLSGVASALQQAIAVQDNHNLNVARLRMLGLNGSKEDLQDLDKAFLTKNFNDVSSAIERAQADAAESRVRRQEANIKGYLLEKLSGVYHNKSASPAWKPNDYLDLLREGMISDAKVRANANMLNNINSARGVVDSLGGFVPNVLKSYKWFKK